MVVCGLVGSILCVVSVYVMEIIWCMLGVVVCRLFFIHILVGGLIMLVGIWHVYWLHLVGSTNPLMVELGSGIMSFEYGLWKDMYMGCVWIVFIGVGLWWVDYMLYVGDVVNYNEADFVKTPSLIVPEIYFCGIYGILRGLSIKIVGICVSGCVIMDVVC